MMAEGGIDKEMVILNEISLWSGCERDYANPDAAASLPLIRQLLLEGRNAEAQDVMTRCIMISVWGLSGVEIHRFAGFSYTGCGRPAAAAMLNAMRFLIFLIPFSLVAWYFHSLNGLFAARLAADLLSGVIGAFLALRTINAMIKRGNSKFEIAPKKQKM
jgi:Na+-driven multidrug efflux pump